MRLASTTAFLALALLAKDQTAAILNAQDVEEQP